MSEITDALCSAGPGVFFSSLGELWSLAHVGPSARAEFSADCKATARRGITESKSWLTAEEVAEDLSLYRNAVERGEYDWGPPRPAGIGMGAAIANVLQGARGKYRLTQILLKPKHGDIPLPRVAEIVEKADAEEYFEALARALSGPNADAPVANKATGKVAKTVERTTTPDVPMHPTKPMDLSDLDETELQAALRQMEAKRAEGAA